jgi:hypothetical protein
MSDSPTYWSQPNQQVVRDGDPVGIMDSGPDPQVETKAGKAKSKDEPKDEAELEPKAEQHKDTAKK